MALLVDEFTRDLPHTTNPRNRDKLNTVLTGSTGSLGTQLLKVLLADKNISTITCLDRSSNARERHENTFSRLGLDEVLQSLPRVQYIQAKYGENQLGLSSTQYSELVSSVDVIIHNAWKVDFNHTLNSFKDGK